MHSPKPKSLATVSLLLVISAAMSWLIAPASAPASAAVDRYDVTMALTSTTTGGIKRRALARGEMTYDSATGEVTFDVTFPHVDPTFHMRGAGLLADAKKSIGLTTYEGFAGQSATPTFTGSALIIGRFKSGGSTFVGRFRAVSDRNGTAPSGHLYEVGRLKAVRR